MSTQRRSAFLRGAAGMQQTDEEIALSKERAEQRKAQSNKPFRFYVPVGETREIIVCDDQPDFFMYEHALKDAEGRWGRLFCGCVKSFDNCPACAATDKESYYAMVLTVIDLTPFKTRDGHTVDFSRKLMIVKPAQQKKFIRFYNKEGTLRGALFEMTRDGDKDSSIGNDIEFVEFVSEDEMATYTRSWKDKEGKQHSENCDEPYIYEDLFEEPTTESIRAIVGGAPAPGSREQAARDVGAARSPARRGRTAPKGDDWQDPRATETFSEPATRGRRRPAAEPEPEPDAPVRGRRAAREELVDDAPPVRGRRAAREEPADDAPVTRGRRAPREEPVDDDVPPVRGRRAAREPEAEPEQREPARRPRSAGREAPPTRGRSAKVADYDDLGDDIPF